ncbi:hypothetical protein JCM6882_005756 [Rhodosporidiobolus microsporus]
MADPQPSPLTPHLAIDLRLRLLESLLAPTTSSAPAHPPATAVPLARRIARVNEQLSAALGTAGAGGGGGAAAAGAGGASEAVRRFVQNYDLNAPLLSVAPIPPGSSSSSGGEDVTPQAKVSLILEAENEIRTLERELREIQVLDERGVVGAGKLGDHEPLKPLLAELRQAATPIAASYASLETRTTSLLHQYNNYISTLSELFVSWNDVLSEAEDALSKLEKERNRGYDIA